MHWEERQVCETAVCLDALHDFALVYEFRAASICRPILSPVDRNF